MSLPDGTFTDECGGARSILWTVWAAPLVVLFGLWIWQAFTYGGFMPHQWLPAALAAGLFGLVASIAVAYPRRPRQLSLVVFGLLTVYTIWVGCSAIWAGSTSRVWLETTRTGMLLIIFGLALVFLTDAGARRWFRYLVIGGALFLFVASIVELWTTDAIGRLFLENRFFFPVTYPNNAAALFLVCFWPLMWLASGPEERAPTRGLALGLAAGMLGLAVMTQSRGAIWSFALSVVLAFILSPARLRTLLYLAVPILLLVYEFPTLNSYWVDGPAAVGGGAGARTLLVAVIATAFIGMILALLERWIQVPGKAKAIIGGIVLVAVLAGAVYGTITLTKDAGGPVGWVSQTWREFTGKKAPEVSESDVSSRLLMATSSGRIQIWEVAWQSFLEDPVLGQGADNFSFQHNLLRKSDRTAPLHAHSMELEVLEGTGIVGGVLAFGAILLALGGILWPRCAAGWRRARSRWLRLPRGKAEATEPTAAVASTDTSDLTTTAPSADEPGETAASEDLATVDGATVDGATVDGAESKTARSWFSSARWGDHPIEYGWEMGLLLGILYWLIHASVDWLWQMTGVAIPLLLLLAAALSEVDARAGILWPRLNRRLRIRSEAVELSVSRAAAAETVEGDHVLGVAYADTAADDYEKRRRHPDKLFRTRRSDRHEARRRKRDKRRQRAAHLQPPGLLSHGFRTLLLVISLAVLVMGGLSYLAIQYQDSALALANKDPGRAVDRAGASRWFQPSSPAPREVQATIYHLAALQAADSLAPDRTGAVLDDLTLAVESLKKAARVEPVNWLLHYRAGVATINLALATAYAFDHDPDFVYTDWAGAVHGLDDWKTSLGPADTPLPPGEAQGSLARTASAQALAAECRAMSLSELVDAAAEHFVAAGERNPLEEEIAAAMQLVDHLRGSQTP